MQQSIILIMIVAISTRWLDHLAFSMRLRTRENKKKKKEPGGSGMDAISTWCSTYLISCGGHGLREELNGTLRKRFQRVTTLVGLWDTTVDHQTALRSTPIAPKTISRCLSNTLKVRSLVCTMDFELSKTLFLMY